MSANDRREAWRLAADEVRSMLCGVDGMLDGTLPGSAAWLRKEHPLVAQCGIQSLVEFDVPSTLEVSSSPKRSRMHFASSETAVADLGLAPHEMTATGVARGHVEPMATLPRADEPILTFHALLLR